MKIIKIKANVSTCIVGSDRDEIINVYLNGDETEKEIEEAKENTAREWMHEQITWGWEDIEDEENVERLYE